MNCRTIVQKNFFPVSFYLTKVFQRGVNGAHNILKYISKHYPQKKGFAISLPSILYYIIIISEMILNYKVALKRLCLLMITLITGVWSIAQNKKIVPPQSDTTRPIPVMNVKTPRAGIKPYKDVIPASALTRKGLLTVHRVEDKWFFEIPDSILNKDILIVNRIAKAPANIRAGFFGYAGDEINQNVIRFEKSQDKKIFLRTISFAVYARDTAGPMYKSVMNSNIQPITAALDIRAFSSDSSATVVDVTDLLMGDNEVFFFANSYKTALRLGGLQNDKSYISDIRSYPINTEIRTVKTFSRSSGSSPFGGGSPAVPGGYATFELNSSMVLLPGKPMRPRYYDDRVAYFTTDYTDFDADPQGVKDVSIITRWRLEVRPGDQEKFTKGELVEPIKPILFYIDPATPAKWVPYLIQGVNDWQKAFEKAGFKNAIVARRAPAPLEDSTWSIEDARYSAIVYKPSDVANAQGPHVHDPRTGEIIESHINWFHNVMSLLQRWYLIQAGASDPRARNPVFEDSLMGQLIRFVSSHEVGHTLGLPHNMGASSATPVEKLRDNQWLAINGHTSSIMDYARFNYVAQPEDKVSPVNLMPRIGDYDNWAIEWGYRPIPDKTEAEEKLILNDWEKTRFSNKRLRFLHADGADPRAQTEDLGDNAMKASAYGIKNLKLILPQLPTWLDKKAENYDRLERMYDELLNQYNRYMGHVITNIGGVYSDPRTSDQPGAVYHIVSKSTQKEAVGFLQQNLFTTPGWLLNRKILDLIDEPSENRLSAIQDNILDRLLSTSRLLRMIGAVNRDKSAYPIDQYITDLRKGIWSELKTRGTIDNYRRNLQKSFVERLINIVQPSSHGGSGGGGMGIMIFFGPPVDIKKSDIVSVAKAQLRSLRREISTAIPGYGAGMSKDHLIDLNERIIKVFEKE